MSAVVETRVDIDGDPEGCDATLRTRRDRGMTLYCTLKTGHQGSHEAHRKEDNADVPIATWS